VCAVGELRQASGDVRPRTSCRVFFAGSCRVLQLKHTEGLSVRETACTKGVYFEVMWRGSALGRRRQFGRGV
jgi:hypothetical protein